MMKNKKDKFLFNCIIYIFQNNKRAKFILILILFFNFFFIPKSPNKIKKDLTRNEDFINKTKLYNPLKNPFLLIILDFEYLNLDEKNISNLIPSYLETTFIDFLVVILLPYTSKKKIIEIFPLINNNIEIKIVTVKKCLLNIIDLINQINSKFTIITNKFLKITKEDIYRIYYMTKGKNNNIFKCKINAEYYLYLIRTKILRDIFDYNIEFKNIDELINYFNYYPLPKLNYIPISFCTDNKYISFCYTSMLSILESKNIFSFIIFYIIIPKDFKQHNIEFLESLYEQFDYFNITFLYMDDRWNNAFTARYLTIHTYYRYSLAELIPNLDKIIYLDVDTICFEDLSDFYNLNFRGKIILGRVLQTNKINNQTYYTINAGILLLNLKEMRKMKIEKDLLNIMKSGFGFKNITNEKAYNKWTKLIMPGQTILNLYFYKYIGPIPPKFNAKDKFDYQKIVQMNGDLGDMYDNDYLYFSFKFPSLKHYPGSKKNLFSHKDWMYFARKSKYFNEKTKNLSYIYNYSFNLI